MCGLEMQGEILFQEQMLSSHPKDQSFGNSAGMKLVNLFSHEPVLKSSLEKISLKNI